ncbi:hypothetical protein [Haliangium sp.]|uniref:hypothetical protein n=1 Tax=Haliangium sp. TaxID=2663208 RepID=UPI003D0F82FD
MDRTPIVTPHRSLIALAAALVWALALAPADARQGKRGHDESVIGQEDCSACHTTESWRLLDGAGGRGFDHDNTGFPLVGAHTQATCPHCHQPGREVSRECASCHQDAHQGRMGTQCDQCHDSRTWLGTRAIERHRLTRLPLTGVHALLECTSCHIRTSSRTWSQVPSDCFACHERDYRLDVHPPHQGNPDNPDRAPFPRDCRLCHRAIAWSPAFADPTLLPIERTQGALRAHDLQFPISFGSHRGARCESCHLSPSTPRALTCTGCHDHSPALLRRQHRGRAVPADAGACLRCHPGGLTR